MQHFTHTRRGHTLPDHSESSKKIVAFEVALLEKKTIAEETMAFVFEKPGGFHFQAGQHIRLTLIHAPETDRKGMRRFFSLASSPQEKDIIIAMRMQNTAFKRVLRRMHIGDKVRIEIMQHSAHDSFVLHDDHSKPAVFLIGGIGIVPAFSMMKDAVERDLPHPMVLFYANRRPEDAPFLDELEHLAEQHPSFQIIATMTQPERSVQSWQGETGYITHAMLTKYVDDLQSPIYYVAGMSEMVNAMKTLLKASGVNKEQIRTEDFSGFKMYLMTRIPIGWKNHFALLVLVPVIIGAVLLHATAAIALAQTAFGTSLLRNPIASMVIGAMVVVMFTLKYVLGFKHGQGRQSAGEISKERRLHKRRPEEVR